MPVLHSLPPRPSQWLIWVVPLAVAALAGAIMPLYVDFMGDSIAKLAALPALIILGLLFAYSRNNLLLLMMLVRGSTETLFESTRISFGGAQLGIGGLMNAFAILIALVLIVERPKLFGETVPRLWGAFLLMLCLGVASSPVKGDAIRQSLALLSNVAVFVGAFAYVNGQARFANCVRLVIASSLVPSIYALYQIATGGGYLDEAGLRLNSTFSHPNIFAFFLTLVIALVFYTLKSVLFKPSFVGKAALTGYLLLLVAFLFLTKTRGAWAACIALFIGYAVFFEKRYFVYLALGAIVAVFIPEVRDRLVDLTQGTTSEISSYDRLNSYAWRIQLWKNALSSMSPARYVTGYGLGAFFDASPHFFRQAGSDNRGAHSVYVQLIYELGIPGLISFLWIFGRLFVLFRQWLKIDRLAGFILLALIVEYLTISYADNMLDYLSFNWYLWFIFGAGFAIATRPSGTDESVQYATPPPA